MPVLVTDHAPAVLHVVCPAGTGDQNSVCELCQSPTWNDGSYPTCQLCRSINFTYDGKSDKLQGNAISFPAARGDDQCMSKYSQLYIDQGNYIAAPATGMTSLGAMANVDACAEGCAAAADTCQYFTFVYAEDTLEGFGGTCYIRAPEGVAINSTLGFKQIYYKMIPTQDMSAQSVVLGRAVEGKEVSNGWYMRWPVGEGEGPQGFDVTNPPSGIVISLKECLRACDMDATCTLVYYNASPEAAAADKCVLKAAGVAARHRTAIRGISGRLVHGAPGPAGAACNADADCQNGNCTTATLTCAAFVPATGKH